MVHRARGRAIRGSVGALVGLVGICVATTAAADPRFPHRLFDAVHTPCPPDCTLCHNNDHGGVNNRRPGSIIGTWTEYYQLDPGDPESVVNAFHAAADEKRDTDGDGIPDSDELLSGSDPDDATPGARYKCLQELPLYGCARVARRGSVDGFAALAAGTVVLIGLAAVRRRVARSRGERR